LTYRTYFDLQHGGVSLENLVTLLHPIYTRDSSVNEIPERDGALFWYPSCI